MTGLPFILKGFLIGIIAAIPIGPILMLTIQKSVSDGRKAGFSCGLGGTAVDTLCAIISAFALSGIGDYVQSHTTVIELVGGLFIMFVGFNMFRTHVAKTRRKKPYSAKNFVKAFTMGLSNPAAIAVMLALFTFFKMDMRNIPQWIPVASILALACGSAGYWYCLSRLVAHFGDRFNFKILVIVNRVAAVGVFIFGAILVYKGIISL